MSKVAAYGVFEGGGAKGLAHVAGVKAAEAAGLEFIGVAGASAGALIAALLAVRYTADEIFDPSNPSAHLLARFNSSPLDLFGAKEWALFQHSMKEAPGALGAFILFGVLGAFLKSRATVAVAAEIRRTGGFFDTDRVRELMNACLRSKLLQHHATAGRNIDVPERIRFSDIDPRRAPECSSLKIIVTDLSEHRMIVLGGSEDTMEVEVAEAVAASIAIPGIFKPARLTSYPAGAGRLYADGGLVSNLPTWVFSEEKLNYERKQSPNGKVPVLGFMLLDKDAPTARRSMTPGSFEHITAVGRSAVFGGQIVAQRFASDLRLVSLPTALDVLQFDFTLDQAKSAYGDALTAATRYLVGELTEKPKVIRGLLEQFLNQANSIINLPNANLRVCVIQRFGEFSFKVTDRFNLDLDADDRLIFGTDSPGAPIAFFEKRPAFIDFEAMRKAGVWPGMTKYEAALIPDRIASAICLPLFPSASAWMEPNASKRSTPLGVVSIDGSANLAHLFTEQYTSQLQSLVSSSLWLGETLKPESNANDV